MLQAVIHTDVLQFYHALSPKFYAFHEHPSQNDHRILIIVPSGESSQNSPEIPSLFREFRTVVLNCSLIDEIQIQVMDLQQD